VAIGFLDGPTTLRMTVAPEHWTDPDLARVLVADVSDPGTGVLPSGPAAIEVPDGTALRDRGASLVLVELDGYGIGGEDHTIWAGVLYVLDEPSAGLHPADAESLVQVLDGSPVGVGDRRLVRRREEVPLGGAAGDHHDVVGHRESVVRLRERWDGEEGVVDQDDRCRDPTETVERTDPARRAI
ncbi:hypothetical protein IAE22_30045, partial [Bacillus sp. S34]|nr:hypothetical protein [Bacillus sp. S34]